MSEKITIEVSELYAEMLTEVESFVGERQIRVNMETFIHNLYQQKQKQEEQQQEMFAVEESNK